MGGFLSGIGSLVAGAGNQAADYGKQIRGLMESRRQNLANLIATHVIPVIGEPYRSQAMTTAANIAGGSEPLGKNLLDITKLMMSHQKDVEAHNQAAANFAQLMPKAPAQETPTPTTGAGIPGAPQPGSMDFMTQGLTPSQPATPPTDVSPTSSVPPTAQGQAQIPMLPQSSDPRAMRREIVQRYDPILRSAPQIMLPVIQNEMNKELDALQPFELQAMREQNLGKLQGTPEYQNSNIPDFLKLGPIEQAYGFTPSPLAGMAGAMFGQPIKERVDTSQLSPQAKQELGIPSEAAGLWTIERARVGRGILSAYPGWAGTTTVTDEEGNQSKVSTNQQLGANAKESVAPGLATSNNRQRVFTDTLGIQRFNSPAGAAANQSGTVVPNAINPALMGRATSTEPTESGGSRSVVQRIPPAGTGGSSAPSTSVPKPSANHPWSGTRPFDESVPVDRIAREIAQDAANWKNVSARGPFSANNPSKMMINKRMAELGIDPNNISGSVRDRAATATTVLPHLDETAKLVQEAKDAGQLGLLKTRLNDIILGKVGTDPSPNHIFTRLADNLAFISSAVGMTHGGVRAGSSIPMIEHWKAVLGAKDPDTLLTQIDVARKWINGYAQMGGASKPVPNTTPNAITPVNGQQRKPLSDIFK